MGSTMSNTNNNNDDADNTSDEEPDLAYIRTKLKPAVKRMDCELDAVNSTGVNSTLSRPTSDHTIISSLLSKDEKISLIYLLIDDPYDALQRMEEVEHTDNFLLPESYNLDNEESRQKLIEALCVIQNYEVLNVVFGKNKFDLQKHYLPLQRCTALKINKVRKCLYRLFEDIPEDDSKLFLAVIQKELGNRFRTFPYLEMHFAYFETIEFVTCRNFESIEKAMVQIKRDAHYEDLKLLSAGRPTGRQINLDRAQGASWRDEDINLNTTSGYKRSSSLSSYEINPKSPGIVAIIENESFYTECEEEYKDLLLPSASKISNRTGSHYDLIRLQNTFEKFNFNVLPKKNLTHNEMLKFVHDVAHVEFQENDSCLYICLLSHGVEGKVIASNSIPVTINDIKSQLHSPNLKGKPKILIIQSCRGEEIQTLTTDSPSSEEASILRTDAPQQYTPPTLDFLEFWSTVPGYASIRDPNKGTWFIQCLCDVIEGCHNELNMYEICIKTRERLLEMEWKVTTGNKTEIRVMVCETRDTLKKLLFLPSIREI